MNKSVFPPRLPASVRVALEEMNLLKIRALAKQYSEGIGVRKNLRVAFALFQAGAQLRDAELAWYAADALEYGEGTPKSPAQAEHYLKLASKLGSAGATTALGELRWSHAKSDAERREAIALYKRAAKQEEPHALHNLGVCMSTGSGLRKNLPGAFRYFLRAAEQGHIEAAFKVGWCLHYGEGVLANQRTAKKWLRRAAQSGHQYAIKLLNSSA